MVPSSIELVYMKYVRYCFLINDVKNEKELDEIAALIKNEMFLFGNAKSELENYIEIKRSILNLRNTVYDDCELVDRQFYYIYSSDDKKLTISLNDDNCNNISSKEIPIIAYAYEGKLCDIISGSNINISLNPMTAFKKGGYILADHAVKMNKDELESSIIMLSHMTGEDKENFKRQLESMQGNWTRKFLKNS